MNRTGWVWFGVLAISTVSYWHEKSLDHFVWHLAHGASAGVIVGALLADRVPVAWPWWALVGYAWMVVPDLLWAAGLFLTGTPYDHEPWMDVFLGHYSLDAYPLWATVTMPVSAGLAAGLWWRAQTKADGRPAV